MQTKTRAVALASVSLLACGFAQAADLSVDATRQPAPLRTEHLKLGTATSPDGHTIGANNWFLTRDGQPWLPVMGEFHYTRFPADKWDEQLAKMKSQGVDVVATYVIWNHHEERPGQFNFAGDRELRRFVTLAQKNGLKVLVRLGPWTHGEVRFGGTPDWVVNAMPSRRNDPTYLGYVDRYWREVYKQVQGLLWKDSGPIIGFQLENEYNLSGPGMGGEHISKLKTMAREIGFDAPLYTVTGWDGAIYPKGEVLPVFAGYPDEPWGLETTRVAPKEVYAFRFDSRVAGNVGAQTQAHGLGTIEQDMSDTPFLGAEYGAGVSIMYRRRPLIAPDDVAAMLPVQLGSGANLYGYYMFQGGRNPQGGTTLEEDDRLGGYNAMPIINYDYDGPLGQYGQVRPVADAVRPYHLFLNAFGARLAPMVVQRPPVEPRTREDIATPRYSVRSRGEQGFLFFNNYVRQYQPPVQEKTRFVVKLPSGDLTFPSQPIDIPSGAHFIWPINFDLDGANLAWATAQPMTRLEDEKGGFYIFSAVKGVPVELAFSDAVSVKLGKRSFKPGADGRTLVSVTAPGAGALAEVRTRAGKTVRVLILDAAKARQAYLLPLAGRDRLVISEDPVYASGGGLTFRSKGNVNFAFEVFPALEKPLSASLALKPGKASGPLQAWSATAAARALTAEIKPLRQAGVMPKPQLGGVTGTVVQPYAETYGRSAAWTLTLPKNALDGLGEAWLDIDYAGDVARLFDGVEMLDDQFYYGTKWEVGLSRFNERLTRPWTLTVLPLRSDTPIYIQDEVKPQIPAGGQIAEVRRVRIIPEYELKVGGAN